MTGMYQFYKVRYHIIFGLFFIASIRTLELQIKQSIHFVDSSIDFIIDIIQSLLPFFSISSNYIIKYFHFLINIIFYIMLVVLFYLFFNSISNAYSPCQIQYCQLCTQNNICSKCQSFYGLNVSNNFCFNCTSNCISCESASKCTTCQQQYYFNQNNLKCTKCSINCKICTKYNCTQCMSYYFLDNMNGQCLSCSPNCQICTSAKTCSQCSRGYFLNSSNQRCVLQCSDPNCLKCQYTDYCLNCKQQYKLINGACGLPMQIKNYPMIIGLVFVSCTGFMFIVLFIKKIYNIIVAQNQSQIIKKIQDIKFNNNSYIITIKHIDNNCPICFEKQCEIMTKCNHHCHLKCLKQWTLYESNCPLCRNQDIRNIYIRFCQQCANKWKKVSLFDPNLEKEINNQKNTICLEHSIKFTSEFNVLVE